MVVPETHEERELLTYVVEDRSVVTTAAVGQMKIHIHHHSLFSQKFPWSPDVFLWILDICWVPTYMQHASRRLVRQLNGVPER